MISSPPVGGSGVWERRLMSVDLAIRSLLANPLARCASPRLRHHRISLRGETLQCRGRKPFIVKRFYREHIVLSVRAVSLELMAFVAAFFQQAAQLIRARPSLLQR